MVNDMPKEVMKMAKLQNTVVSRPVKSLSDVSGITGFDYLRTRVIETGTTERALLKQYVEVYESENLSDEEKYHLGLFIKERLHQIDTDKTNLDVSNRERERVNEWNFLLSTSGQIGLGFLTYVVVPIVTVKICQKKFVS